MARQKKVKPEESEDQSLVSTDSSWILLKYVPVSLFSLRSTMSTSKGGKTLLVPTPYAVKMSLIDATFRKANRESGDKIAREMFSLIKGRCIRIKPPKECIVQNTFVKIRQEERDAPAGIYVPTIAYRELVFYQGQMEIAISAGGLSDQQRYVLIDTACHVNYFGKRGSFFQFFSADHVLSLPDGFSLSLHDNPASMPLGVYGVSQFLDDFGPDLCRAPDGFERISTYHENTITLDKHRVLKPTLLPYRQVEATRSFTRYSVGDSYSR